MLPTHFLPSFPEKNKKKHGFPCTIWVWCGSIRLDISHQFAPFILQLLAFLLAHLQVAGEIHTAQLGLLAPGKTGQMAIETEFRRRILTPKEPGKTVMRCDHQQKIEQNILAFESPLYFAGWSEKKFTYKAIGKQNFKKGLAPISVVSNSDPRCPIQLILVSMMGIKLGQGIP